MVVAVPKFALMAKFVLIPRFVQRAYYIDHTEQEAVEEEVVAVVEDYFAK